MSMGELLLTVLVALVVFGPNKLPMLAFHLGKWIQWFERHKQQALALWQSQLQQHQLQDNEKKAEEADEKYPSKAPQENLKNLGHKVDKA
jgi:sec-independent protein translocase protein TatB